MSGGADHDVHDADLVDLVILDLGEDQMLLDAQGIVAAAVEGVSGDAAEVADAGQGHVEQAIPFSIRSRNGRPAHTAIS